MTVIVVTGGIEETDKTCPYTSLISLMVAISGLFPEWVTKWAGFFGVVGCLLRNTTVIDVTMGIEETDKTCPYRTLPELSAP